MYSKQINDNKVCTLTLTHSFDHSQRTTQCYNSAFCQEMRLTEVYDLRLRVADPSLSPALFNAFDKYVPYDIQLLFADVNKVDILVFNVRIIDVLLYRKINIFLNNNKSLSYLVTKPPISKFWVICPITIAMAGLTANSDDKNFENNKKGTKTLRNKEELTRKLKIIIQPIKSKQ